MSERDGELRTWVDELFAFLARVAGAINRKNARFLQEATALMSPYALRNLSRRKLRGIMLGASIALALTTFLLFSAYSHATTTRLVGRVSQLELGGGVEAIAVASYDTLRVFPDDVAQQSTLRARGKADAALITRLYSSYGTSRFWGFKGDGLAAGAVELVEGAFPRERGEVVVPQSWAAELEARVGDPMQLAYLHPESHQWRELEGRVVGIMKEGSYTSQYPVTTFDTLEDLRDTSGPNAVFMRWSADTAGAVGVKKLRSLLDPVLIITPQTPQQRGRQLVGGVFSPVRLVLLIIFAFSALGVLNVMLLSFLQRKRQFGILKASGAEDRELQVLLLLEGFLMALGGVAAGLSVSLAAVLLLNRYTPDRYVLDSRAVVIGVALSAVVFYLGAWLPISMLRRATVDELLRDRRLT